MSSLCRQVGPFLDGELSAAAAASFRQHLGTCTRCPGELEKFLLLDTLAEQALGGGAIAPSTVEIPVCDGPRAIRANAAADSAVDRHRRPERPKNILERAWSWSLPRLWIPLSVGAAATWALVRWTGSNGEDAARSSAPSMLAALDVPRCRATLGRIADDRFAPAAPCKVTRAGGGAAEADLPRSSQAALARLQEQNDQHGLAAAYLSEHDLAGAEMALAKAGESVDVVSDRAVLALERGDFAEALRIADAVLARAPGHVAASWNRAVALEHLGRRPEAARQFAAAADAAAARGESAWAAEARGRAAALTAAGP
jgi:hypothetical protein